MPHDNTPPPIRALPGVAAAADGRCDAPEGENQDYLQII